MKATPNSARALVTQAASHALMNLRAGTEERAEANRLITDARSAVRRGSYSTASALARQALALRNES
jgi:hypothetical protein